jgi:hypothetical protein
VKFNHIGITDQTVRSNSVYFAPTKVWITDSDAHPYRIEWLRYDDDSQVPSIVRQVPHVGFEVESIEESGAGLELLLGPLVIDPSKTVAFFKTLDGGVVELMEIRRG